MRHILGNSLPQAARDGYHGPTHSSYTCSFLIVVLYNLSLLCGSVGILYQVIQWLAFLLGWQCIYMYAMICLVDANTLWNTTQGNDFSI